MSSGVQPNLPDGHPLPWCRPCNKRRYKRKQALTTSAQLTSAHPADPRVDAYKCPCGNGWHIGHVTRASAATGVQREHRRDWAPANARSGQRTPRRRVRRT